MYKIHGMHNTPEYMAWQNMTQRCTNSKHPSYERYGGRGIEVCERWLHSFEAFYQDMGPKPEPKEVYSLEREKNHLGYFPGNCKWATKTEQQRNTSQNYLVDVAGKPTTLAELSETYRVDPVTIKNRLERGLSLDKATEPPKSNPLYDYKGESFTMKELSDKSGIGYQTLYARIVSQGWSVERAMETPVTPR